MVAIVIRIDDLEAREELARLDAAAGDLTPLMDGIGALLEQSARDRIEDTNRAPDGAPWERSFRAELDGGRTLFDSGRLAASLTHQAGRSEVQIGTDLPYAGIHQTGGEIVPAEAGALRCRLPDGGFAVVGKVTIPARPYLGVSETDAGEIGAIASGFLGGGDA